MQNFGPAGRGSPEDRRAGFVGLRGAGADGQEPLARHGSEALQAVSSALAEPRAGRCAPRRAAAGWPAVRVRSVDFMRLRRKAGGAVTVRGLSVSQKFDLMFGVGPLTGDQSFASPDEYVQVWQRYRDSLLAECSPWHRPDAYCAVEVQYQPT